ncbi:MAG: hypothetical protein HC834_09300 [Rhodospirillales bacterium]|nr:hypothetical protein [Rhodospirillales bacterium]
MLGWIQFKTCYLLGTRVTKRIAMFFAAAAVIAYLATDVGTYRTLEVPVVGVEGIPDGNYKLSQLMPFSAYMSMRLGSSKVESSKGGRAFEMGSVGTKISFAVDLLGAAIGALGALFILMPLYPYCSNCNIYKRRHHRYTIKPESDEATIQAILASIAESCQRQDHDASWKTWRRSKRHIKSPSLNSRSRPMSAIARYVKNPPFLAKS